MLYVKSTKREVPWEYVELQLCRDVYHIDRLTLYEQDLEDTLLDLEMLGVESRVNEFEKASKHTGSR